MSEEDVAWLKAQDEPDRKPSHYDEYLVKKGKLTWAQVGSKPYAEIIPFPRNQPSKD
jgi:hypothetical protein